MPLVTLTTKTAWHPTTGVEWTDLTPRQQQIVAFGKALPDIIFGYYCLTLSSDLPAVTSVRVVHVLANSHNVHSPDLDMKFEFAETGWGNVQREIALEIRNMCFEWFNASDFGLITPPQIGWDCIWPDGSYGSTMEAIASS